MIRNKLRRWWIVAFFVLLGECAMDTRAQDRTFGEDVSFLADHVDVVALGDEPSGPRLVVVPEYQARVMTSSATGDSGTSFGWINYDCVRQGITPGSQIHVFGGEERFWLGPEGGQFGLFFSPGAKFDFDHWQTPAVIDTEAFAVVERDAQRVVLQHDSQVTNYSGTRFPLHIHREVVLLDDRAISDSLDLEFDGSTLAAVAYRTVNRITNTGDSKWSEDSGLLSIWLLGMYKHSPKTTVVIPFRQGVEGELGTVVVDDYFGRVPDDRLRVGDGILYFAADGKYRSKIGVSPRRATGICGSFDGERNVLTVVKYQNRASKTTNYVNSKWELQGEPYAGDVINAYNDGPPAPDKPPLGPFYELETSSPALALAPGEVGEHVQETMHFQGERIELDRISRALFSVSLDQIESALD